MSTIRTSAWTPDSWRSRPVLQVPQYPDAKALADVEAQLATFPPLVFAGEARNLKKALARVAVHGRKGDIVDEDVVELGLSHRDFPPFLAWKQQMRIQLVPQGVVNGAKAGA